MIRNCLIESGPSCRLPEIKYGLMVPFKMPFLDDVVKSCPLKAVEELGPKNICYNMHGGI
jgi:hypothetical protein